MRVPSKGTGNSCTWAAEARVQLEVRWQPALNVHSPAGAAACQRHPAAGAYANSAWQFRVTAAAVLARRVTLLQPACRAARAAALHRETLALRTETLPPFPKAGPTAAPLRRAGRARG